MLKKTITYTNFNGDTITEDFYFNLSKAEIMEMELSTNGGVENLITKIIKANDQAELIKLFKTFILKAYGEKSDDGRHFMKSPEISKKFECSEAYSELFMELVTNTNSANEFLTGIMPKIPGGVNIDPNMSPEEALKKIDDIKSGKIKLDQNAIVASSNPVS